MSAGQQRQDFAARRVNTGSSRMGFGAGDFDDARLMQQAGLAAGGIRTPRRRIMMPRCCPSRIRSPSKRIVGTRETQVDHLSVRIECCRERAGERE